MPIVLHDTLTSEKRELVPLEPGKIRFYACGPTVYDFSHVGHARSYVVWDVVVRHLRALGVEPADLEPLATEHIPEMVDIIRRLEEKGLAYGAEVDHPRVQPVAREVAVTEGPL